jgi:hypothetical protein
MAKKKNKLDRDFYGSRREFVASSYNKGQESNVTASFAEDVVTER